MAGYAQGGGANDCGYGTWDAGSCSAACRAGDGWRSTPTAAACCSVRRRGASASGTDVERRVVRRLPLDFTPHYLALDPEGRRLAVNNADPAAPRVAILELETGRVLADWRSQVGNGAMAWSADGQLLAVGGGGNDPRVYVWNVRRGALASVLQGHTAQIIGAQFAHTGYLLATASWDGTTRLWDAAAGEPLATAPGGFLGFAPDDRRLAFVVGGKIGVWDVAAGAGVPDAPPRHARQPLRGAGRHRGDRGGCQPRRPAGGDLRRGWRPPLGGRHGPRAGPSQGRCLRDRAVSPRRAKPDQLGKWGLYRWPIRPDPERGPDAIRVGPPELLQGTRGQLSGAKRPGCPITGLWR